jgi:hypothetical protein
MLRCVRSDLPAPDFTVANHFPELTRLAQAVRAADWSTVEAFFAGRTDPDDRVSAAWMVTGMDESAPLLEAHANGTLGRTLHGIRLVLEGWNIRTEARARHVSREQFAGFHEYVSRAERVLIDATALNPDDIVAWTERVVIARALSFGQSEARRRYDRIGRHAPHVLCAQRQLLQKLCPKWGGSFDAAEAFVRERVAAAPEGSPVPALIVEFHTERWLEGGTKSGLVRYMSDPAVRADVRAAAERTVWNPQFRPGLLKYEVHNLFAFTFSAMDEPRLAAQEFAAIGACATRSPWSYLGDKETVFTEHRAAALARG